MAFWDVADASGSIQLYLKSDTLKATDKDAQLIGIEHIDLIDVGDVVQASGLVTTTQSGERSIEVVELKMLTKTIRPLPNSFEEKEDRYRRRYVDMVVNPQVRERMVRRAAFWQAHREFLNERGFHEVNIPILEHIPGGGDAVPFTTHMNAIDEDFFLRISHELPLKRLVGAGFEKVYDIGARFRNEGLSDEHLPEHVAMEFYWAYADWEDGMKFIQELFMYVIEKVYGDKKTFKIREFEVDFSKEWERIDFADIMRKNFGIKDLYNVTLEEVTAALEDSGIEFDPETVNIPRGVDSLWKKLRKTIAGPAFLINHPKYLSPLQKPSKENPQMVERFQPIIAGSELGNGWSEVNDAVDQYNRFVEQQEMRDSGDDEAQWLDIDYVEMLEYGMPPTFGWGHSERLFWFLEDVSAREGVPFPQLKFHISDSTKKIYPEIDFSSIRSTQQNVTNKFLDAEIDLDSLAKLDIAHVDPSLIASYPGTKFGYAVLEGVKVSPASEEVTEAAKLIEKKVKGKYSDKASVKQSENIASFRQLYKDFGTNPNSKLNSAEAIMRRIAGGKGLYQVNNVVDTYNISSAEFELPMAAYDLESIQGKLTLRLAKDADEMVKIGDTEATPARVGEVVYADDGGVTCLSFNYRDSDRTKITNKTERVIVFVDGTADISEAKLIEALAKTVARLEIATGGQVVGYGTSF